MIVTSDASRPECCRQYQTTSARRAVAGVLRTGHGPRREPGRCRRPFARLDERGPRAPAPPLGRRRSSTGSTGVPGREDRLRHLEVLPARAARARPTGRRGCPTTCGTPSWPQGVARPWRHQVAAADAAHAGQHVVAGDRHGVGQVAGLPAAGARRRSGPRAAPAASGAPAVLYLAPTKALAHDQLAGLAGARPRRARSRPTTATARARSGTGRATSASTSSPTPTCCTARCCPAHARWASFLGSLQYVVVDECHHYRGVFGAHVSHVLRRLRRVCAMYGAHPTFVLASATVAEPGGRRRRG